MNKHELEQRLHDLEALAREKDVYDAISKASKKIRKTLQAANPNLSLINFQLSTLENNILQESDPQFILTRLTKELRSRANEIENNDLKKFDMNSPLFFHPFELLQYDNIESQISEYEQQLTQLLESYHALIAKLPQTANHKAELTEVILEKEKLEKKYHDTREAKPIIHRISSENTLTQMISQHKDKIEIRGYSGRTLLIQYAVRGKQNLMGILLENGANINAQTDLGTADDGNNALLWSIANAYVNQTLWLLKNGKKYGINYDLFGHGNTALLLAIAKGPTHVTDEIAHQVPGGFGQIIMELVDQGADVKLQDKKNGFSPLHLAVLHRDIDLIQTLIKAGADIHCEDKLNRKPLDMLKLSTKEIKAILKNQCEAFTLSEENWKKRGFEIQQLLEPGSSPSPELPEDSQSISNSSASSDENSSDNLRSPFQDSINKLSEYAIKIKKETPKTSRQREGNAKVEKIEELVSKIKAADTIEAIQALINSALKSDYKKGRQQNPLLVNRGPMHAYWIHSIFTKKRNTEAHRLSRSKTEDLLIDLKEEVDTAVNTSQDHNLHIKSKAN